MSAASLHLRLATAADAPLVLSFIRELAEYEKILHRVTATEERIRETIFGPQPCADVVLAYLGDEPVGFAVYFTIFSTFRAERGMYLEDLFVRPHARGNGVGRALLAHVASEALRRGCAKMEWTVLDWNELAIRFYNSLGAELLNDWRVFRLTGDALNDAASA
jgi:GNAT superfamily N-acetyltransferase